MSKITYKVALFLLFGAVALPVAAKVARLDNGVVNVGFELNFGGAISELGPLGQNYINGFDSGRLVGVSIYDNKDSYPFDPGSPNWGWNPVVSDKYGHVNEPVDYELGLNSFRSLTRLIQWNPDEFGGNSLKPAASELTLEQWVDFVPGEPRALALRYRITNNSATAYATRIQELPYIYFNPNLSHLTNGQDVIRIEDTFTGLPLKKISAPQRWLGAVDERGQGLFILGEQATEFEYTWHQGEGAFKTNYLIPSIRTGFPPGAVRNFRFKIFVGSKDEAARYFAGHDFEKPLIFFMRAAEDGNYYRIFNHRYHPLGTLAVLALYTGAQKFPPFSKSALPFLDRVRLVRAFDSEQVYYLTTSGARRLMPNNLTALESYGNTADDIVAIHPAELARYPEIKLVKNSARPEIYLIENGRKRHIASWSALLRNGFKNEPVAPVSALELKAFPDGAPLN